MRKIRVLSIILAIIVLMSVFFGCGSAPGASKNVVTDGAWNGAAADKYAPEMGETVTGTTGTTVQGGSALSVGTPDPTRKIIYSASYELESTAFDDARKALQTLCERLGGYVESSNLSAPSRYNGRRANSVLRIPAEKLNDFFADIGNVGSITSESLSSKDVTLEFVDVEARLDALKQQRDRIVALLEKASSLQYVLEIERELSDINYQIESYTTRRNTLASQVSYATVNVTLREVVTLTQPAPITFGQRLKTTFQSSVSALWDNVQDFGVWFLGNSVVIVIDLGLIALALFVLARVIRRRRAWKAKSSSEEK